MLPVRARHARALLCPANLAPLAHPRNVIVIHDAAALRHPEWYSPAYVRWQRTVMPRIARSAKLVITVSEFARAEQPITPRNLAQFRGPGYFRR